MDAQRSPNPLHVAVESAFPEEVAPAAPALDAPASAVKRFEVFTSDPGVFVHVDGREVVYWDTSDTSHQGQGCEIAEALVVLYEQGVDAFLAHVGGTETGSAS
jgi:hypothetical protein